MFVIFIYILYTVIVNQRYLITEEPGGGKYYPKIFFIE